MLIIGHSSEEKLQHNSIHICMYTLACSFEKYKLFRRLFGTWVGVLLEHKCARMYWHISLVGLLFSSKGEFKTCSDHPCIHFLFIILPRMIPCFERVIMCTFWAYINKFSYTLKAFMYVLEKQVECSFDIWCTWSGCFPLAYLQKSPFSLLHTIIEYWTCFTHLNFSHVKRK